MEGCEMELGDKEADDSLGAERAVYFWVTFFFKRSSFVVFSGSFSAVLI